MRNVDRERAINDIVGRIVGQKMAESLEGRGTPIAQVINDTIFHEKKRLKIDSSATAKAKSEDYAFWNAVQKKLPSAGERELKQILTDSTERFAREVAGNFNPYVYQASVRAVPLGLSFLLNAVSPKRLISQLPTLPSINNNIHLSGKIKELQALEKRGTVVLVPTHLSNLDSPVIGWAIYKMGLPPFTYGAGLNLFSNPLLGFFMHNLGAYRVDRRKKAGLYKDVLKTYSTCAIEYGYHSLFFPGGTRSRSGMLERRIKKGLLGTATMAYVNNLHHQKERPKIFVVPCTINYHLVLEAKSLIEDHLKESGRSRYIIDDDEFSQVSKIFQFASNLVTMDSQIHVVIGQALDPFGNEVDMHGQSYDKRGRAVDAARYVKRKGKVVVDPQRDQEYTNELGKRIVQEFEITNMIMSTHLVAHACFQLLQEKNPQMDLYRLIHTGGNIDHLPQQEVCARTDLLLQSLLHLEDEGKICVEPWLRGRDSREIVNRAVSFFHSYHGQALMQRRGDHFVTNEVDLLHYYSNRLFGYALPHERH